MLNRAALDAVLWDLTNVWCRVSRRMLLGSFKKLQVEDYLMLFAMVRHSNPFSPDSDSI